MVVLGKELHRGTGGMGRPATSAKLVPEFFGSLLTKIEGGLVMIFSEKSLSREGPVLMSTATGGSVIIVGAVEAKETITCSSRRTKGGTILRFLKG